jgi:hypothetical protein
MRLGGRHKVAVLVVAAALLAAGCGESTTAGPPTATPASHSESPMEELKREGDERHEERENEDEEQQEENELSGEEREEENERLKEEQVSERSERESENLLHE